ncbi:acid-soluble spore protein K [Pontibacillus halophilus JSM 076056 = DSM 19796]|uniref:Small, acid-soluble spore protein K n=1 Tax=Pontibacillus halophilus JSM 076056 = DSM 19796 TaxID=1385510 RepID=A0A0A5G5S9_9BACI|nr:small, acid-soluble spore protein K [Pontibacillus halophilus]KGX87414.1 acid-soluble spore protein K [Pontibacillus halophilus JSM 076056 = DSM 19796]
MARNKQSHFPSDQQQFDGEPRAKAEYAPKRANGTINQNPQERMNKSSHRNK